MMHPVTRKKHQLTHRSLSQPVFHDLPDVRTNNSLPHANNTQMMMSRQHRQLMRSAKPGVDRSPRDGFSTASIKLSVENLPNNLPNDGYHGTEQYMNEYNDIPEYGNGMYTNKAYRSSSPNNDSAIENTSPSSVSSGSYVEQSPCRPTADAILETDGHYRSGITSISGDERTSRGNSLRRHRYEDDNMPYRHPPTMQSYYGVDGVAVSQI